MKEKYSLDFFEKFKDLLISWNSLKN
jgi:hypothetical protein